MSKVLIVSSNFYQDISNNLVNGAKDFLKNYPTVEFEHEDVPGCFEIPYIINANNEFYEGFIALGCIIRGETYHFELISNEVTRKIMDLSVDHKKPIGFGILTCENLDQAIQRSDPFLNPLDNKGREAAQACVRLMNKNISIKNKLNG
jgi:6,7-dimethyl-8-ribityllumazine synthase|tara:strand:- start:7253 stop:7696 length:444 start_codon:yes stop_codon:yes gene_type:complete